MSHGRILVVVRGTAMASLFVAPRAWLAAPVRQLDPSMGIAVPGWHKEQVSRWRPGCPRKSATPDEGRR